MNPVLTCNIEIGDYVFNHVEDCRIERTFANMVQTAVLKFPSKYKENDKVARMAELITVGMPVLVQLGYDNELNTEFEGFVSEVLPNVPLEIKCEDLMWQLKREKPTAASWESVSLKEIIRHILPDIDESKLVVDDIVFSPFYIKDNLSKAKVLEKLKDEYPLVVYFKNGKIFAGKVYQDPDDVDSEHVIYCMNHAENNIVKSGLTYKKRDDVRIKLKMTSHMPDGSKVEYETGDDDGEIRTWNDYNKTLAELKAMADEKIELMKYDGYTGSIQTLGFPFIQFGQIAEFYDGDNPGKDGWYFVDKTVVEFGKNGFKREVHFGKRAGGEE